MRPQQAAKAMTATENKDRRDTDQASLEAKTHDPAGETRVVLGS